MDPAPSQNQLVAGARLGPFTLRRKLALGGMAELWEAERDQAPRRLALKVLLPHLATDPGFRAMFQDEVNISVRLNHENIVEVYGAHAEDGLLLQSMELIDGQDLRRLLSQLAGAGQRFPVHHALAIVQRLARGLGYAHQRRGPDGELLGIVHRDVSPHNVMIARSGRVKLLDFGIARAAERLARTRTGVLKGKVAYMAPEQAMAQPTSPRTDIFAAGVVLWEMLAMQRLFRGQGDAETLEAVLDCEVPPIRALNPEVSAEVAELVHQMLRMQPEDRPASMREVETRLTRILALEVGAEEVNEAALGRWAGAFLPSERSATPALVVPEGPEAVAVTSTLLPEGGDASGPEVVAVHEDDITAPHGALVPDHTEPSAVPSGAQPTVALPARLARNEQPDHRGPVLAEPGPPDFARSALPAGSDPGPHGRPQVTHEVSLQDPSGSFPPGDVEAATLATHVPSGAWARPEVGDGAGLADDLPTALEPSDEVALVISANTPSGDTPVLDTTGSNETRRFKAPTRSQIIRAVDAQKTVPVRADHLFVSNPAPRVMSVPSAPSRALDPAVRSDLPEDQAPGVVRPPERRAPSPPPEPRREPPPEPRREPPRPEPGRRAEVPREPGFERISPKEQRSLPGQPPPRSEGRTWILPVITIALALMVVVLLAVLLVRGA